MAGGSFFSRVFAHISRSSAKLPGSALKLKSSPQLPQPWTRLLTVPSPSRHRKSTAVSFSPRSTMQLPCLTPASFQVLPPWLISMLNSVPLKSSRPNMPLKVKEAPELSTSR